MASSPNSSSGAEAKPQQQSQFAPPTFLQDEARLAEFFATWEAGKLPKSEWTHAAHVAMAAWHAYEHGVDATFARMKAGIIRHNESVGTANTETSGYHETLTRFWASEICAVIGAGNYGSRLEAVRAAVSKFAEERDRFRRFYSFDVVGDRRARREWIPPDRAGEPVRRLAE